MISLLFSGCSTSQRWTLNSISAGDRLFDSTRLRYKSQNDYPEIVFEMVRLGGVIESYISLTRFRLPAEKKVKIAFETEDQTFEEMGSVHAGGMRLRLSPESTEKIIVALQAQKKVAILMGDFEETLDPAQFSTFFTEFVEEGNFFKNILKGLVR